MANYEFLENNEWVIKTKVTQEMDIDVAKQLKTIREYRAAFAQAWGKVIELAGSMADYCLIHESQNELLKQLGDYLGEDYTCPELKSPFDVEKMLADYKAFLDAEKEFRAKHAPKDAE